MFANNWRRIMICAAASLITTLGAFAWAAASVDEPADPKPPQRPARQARPQREQPKDERGKADRNARPRRAMVRLFERLDANQDGVIDKTEFQQRAPRILHRMHQQHRMRGEGKNQSVARPREARRSPPPNQMQSKDQFKQRGRGADAAPMFRRQPPMPQRDGNFRPGPMRQQDRDFGPPPQRGPNSERDRRGPPRRMENQRPTEKRDSFDSSRNRRPPKPRTGDDEMK